MRHKAFNYIAQEDPLPITKDAECGIQDPFNTGQCLTALARRGTYISGFNYLWLDLEEPYPRDPIVPPKR